VTALDLGFEPDRVLVGLMDIDRMGRSTREVDALFRRMEERVRKIPNVQAVAAAVTVPSYWNYGARIAIPGIPSVLVPEGGVYRNAVRPDYFTAMGIRILQGRGFTEADERPGAAVAIINETMARRVWPAGQPLGSCVRFVERPAAEPSGPVAEVPCAEIIGVAEDSRHGNWVEDEIFHVHLPLAQAPSRMAQRVLVVRPAGRDPAGLIEPVRREMQGLAPDLPYAEVEVLAARFADELRPWRLGAAMFGVLGLLAIVLAVVGLYAVVSFSVVGRTHEIGVRMAIGAGRGAVVALVLRQGLTIAVTGIAIGLGIAVLAGRFIASLLYETSPRDPVVLGGVAGFLILAAVAASLIPSWRAARIDPAIALRSD
jgi:predicted permease